MGWTFTELDEQPAWRIEQAFAFLSAEAKHAERERKKNEQRARARR